MVKKAKANTSQKRAANKTKSESGEMELTKGEQRKLNALCKSIGDELGKEAFEKWLKQQRSAKTPAPEDKNASVIAETLFKLIEEEKLRMPRGGYLVTRGRGRVNVTRPKTE